MEFGFSNFNFFCFYDTTEKQRMVAFTAMIIFENFVEIYISSTEECMLIYYVISFYMYEIIYNVITEKQLILTTIINIISK